MTKEELINSIASKVNLTGSKKVCVNEVLSALIQEIHRQPKLRIHGLGTFEHKVRAEHTCRNPKTGESMQVPEKTVLTFKASR